MVRNHAEHKSREPDDQAQKGERLRSPPLTTVVAAAQTNPAPSPRASAARAVEPDDEQREDGGPACCEDFSCQQRIIVGIKKQSARNVRRSEPYEAMVDFVGIIQMMENRMESEDHTMAKIVRPKGPTPWRVREYMKYAVRPRTTAAKANCAMRRMTERRREKIIVVVTND